MLPHADGPPLDPSSGEARRWLADELAKREYGTEENPIRRAFRVIIEWFTGLFEGTGAGTAVSRWWFFAVIAVLLAILLLIVWAVVRLQPGRRARRVAEGGIFDEAGISAADYQRRATRALRDGDFDVAVLDGYRAIAAGAVERFILDDRPGATAREIAVTLSPTFPAEAAALAQAATDFGAVRYGEEPADRTTAQRMLDLGARLAEARPELEEVRA